jgi:glycosyltransferase involved in cell wall biosynthesis
MKIVVDLQACQSGSRLGGIGRYSMDLLKAMADSIGKHELHVVLSRLLPQAELDIRVELAGHIAPENIVSFSVPGTVTGYQPANRGRRLVGEKLRLDFLRSLKPDIVHVASFVEGWAEDVVVSIGEPAMAQKTAITWYDLIPFVKPEMYLTDERLAEYYYHKIDEAKQARLLLAISQYTRDEAVELLHLPADQVVNISSGVSSQFERIPFTTQHLEQLKSSFGIDRPFILFTGSFDARKNQSGLIKAVANLPSEVRDRYQLVIVGNGWDGIYAELRKLAAEKGLPPQNLIFTGRVTEEQLLLLYNTTRLFVFPTFREGFGLPVLEAMACGAPVIGSNCTSVPEVIGRTDALFDPHDTTAITQKIYDVLTNEQFRQSLIEHGGQHYKKFTWAASAKTALDAFEARFAPAVRSRGTSAKSSSGHEVDRYPSLLDTIAGIVLENKVDSAELPQIAESLAHNEAIVAVKAKGSMPRIGWVTPWAKRCGVACYSKYLIDYAPEPPVAIFAERGCTATNMDSRSISGNKLNPQVYGCWTSGESDDLSELSQAVDNSRLDALLIQCHYGFYNFPALRNLILRQVAKGVRVFIMLHSTSDPPPAILPKTLAEIKDALLHCERIFVHTHADAGRLKNIGVVHNVSPLPHGIPGEGVSLMAHQQKSDLVTLATYGFFLPHKGLKEIVEAFAILAQTDNRVHLRMVNAEYPHECSSQLIASIRALVDDAGLDHRVEMITDYLEDEESLHHLSQADMIVFPYQATTEPSSASARMGIASGRLIAVTPHSIFDDISGAAVTLPGSTPEAMAEGLTGFVARIRAGVPDVEFSRVLHASAQIREVRAWSRISHQMHCLIEQSCRALLKKSA